MESEFLKTVILCPDEQLCRVSEASRYLALSRSKLYELMDSGKLTYVKIGRSRRIPISAIDALIQRSKIER